MKKNKIISPIGLKGNQINERMRELMGMAPINENKSEIVVETTKMGPDGNAYAIIRENHEWFIKKATKSSNIVAEDFKYIGGLANKRDAVYNSYNKALKHLGLKFRSLAEAYNFTGEINVFENDNLLSEDVAGFAQMEGLGFSGEGNLEGNTPLSEEEYDKHWHGDGDDDEIDAAEDEKTRNIRKHLGSMDDIDAAGIEEACDDVEEYAETVEAHATIDEMIAEMSSDYDYNREEIEYHDKKGMKPEDLEEAKDDVIESLEEMEARLNTLAESLVKKKV